MKNPGVLILLTVLALVIQSTEAYWWWAGDGSANGNRNVLNGQGIESGNRNGNGNEEYNSCGSSLRNGVGNGNGNIHNGNGGKTGTDNGNGNIKSWQHSSN